MRVRLTEGLIRGKNMKLKNLVVSLETAKKLKEAGFSQDTVFSWDDPSETDSDYDTYFLEKREKLESAQCDSETLFAAPTLEELLSQLPSNCCEADTELDMHGGKVWCSGYGHTGMGVLEATVNAGLRIAP